MDSGPEKVTGWLYMNAAKGIQKFIFATDKLKEMIGGSELVEELPSAQLDRVLSTLRLQEGKDYSVIMRAAGGVCLLLRNENQAHDLARLWPFVVELTAPGLQVVQAVVAIADGRVAEAMNTAEQQLNINRNTFFPQFPEAGPLVRRCRRSGLPASRCFDGKPIDELTAAKLKKKTQASMSLLQKIVPAAYHHEEGGIDPCQWPSDFEELGNKESYLAIIHADANGLGALRMQLSSQLVKRGQEEAARLVAQFSQAVERATLAAAQRAITPLLQMAKSTAEKENRPLLYPIRPIICAGDDLTLIMEATQAFTFVTTFLASFEEESAREFASLGVGASDGLTACAGIAYVKRKFPFALAYNLCESLCAHSKQAVRRQASALSFFRVTTSSVRDYEHILRHDLTTEDSLLSMAPYLCGHKAESQGPTAAELLGLVAAMKGMPKGSFRSLVSKANLGRTQAQQAFARICDIAQPDKVSALRAALTALTGNQTTPLWQEEEGLSRTPVFDALELLRLNDCTGEH